MRKSACAARGPHALARIDERLEERRHTRARSDPPSARASAVRTQGSWSRRTRSASVPRRADAAAPPSPAPTRRPAARADRRRRARSAMASPDAPGAPCRASSHAASPARRRPAPPQLVAQHLGSDALRTSSRWLSSVSATRLCPTGSGGRSPRTPRPLAVRSPAAGRGTRASRPGRSRRSAPAPRRGARAPPGNETGIRRARSSAPSSSTSRRSARTSSKKRASASRTRGASGR